MPAIAAPAWYPDPSHPAVLRYWDGEAWTTYTRPDIDDAGQPPAKRPVWETVAIVVAVTLGAIGLIGLVFILMLFQALDNWGENK